jgi:hypothetical protein
VVARGLKKAKRPGHLSFSAVERVLKTARSRRFLPPFHRYLDLCGKSMGTKRDVSDMVPADTWLFLTALTGDVDPCLMMRWLAP